MLKIFKFKLVEFQFLFIFIAEESEDSSTWSDNSAMNKLGLTFGRSLNSKFNSKYNRNFKSRTFATLRRAKHGKLYSSGLENNYLPINKNVETITNHIEQQEELMKDNLVSKMKRLETLREMPQCLTIKRSIKANLTNSINLKTEIKVVSRWKQIKYSTSIFWIKVIIQLTYFIYFKEIQLIFSLVF